MIRPLRRAHPIAVGIVAAVTMTVAGMAGGRRLPPQSPMSPLPVSLDSPDFPREVFAAAAWTVEPDTLYLELARIPGDSVGLIARFTASAGARWPDAVILWSPTGPGARPADGETLGTVSAGQPLVTRLPAAGGAVFLHSIAWDRALGSWSLPTSPPAAGVER